MVRGTRAILTIIIIYRYRPAMTSLGLARALLVALLLGACGAGAAGDPEERPVIVASFYPLAFAAERVAGERADVEDLTPPGVEPHDLELSPRQVALLHRADLVVYVGAGFQPALEDVIGDLTVPKIDVLDAVDVLGPAEPSDEHHDHEDAHAEGVDPHIWLDPQRMQDIAAALADHLGQVDPAYRRVYERNAGELVDALRDLDAEIARGLDTCETRALVVSHEAFGYLAERYELDQVGIAGLDPESEPSPRRLAEAVAFARAADVRTIFFERLVSPAVAETVAREVGARTAVLDPLESAPPSGDYLDAMRANLKALSAGLGCS